MTSSELKSHTQSKFYIMLSRNEIRFNLVSPASHVTYLFKLMSLGPISQKCDIYVYTGPYFQ